MVILVNPSYLGNEPTHAEHRSFLLLLTRTQFTAMKPHDGHLTVIFGHGNGRSAWQLLEH